MLQIGPYRLKNNLVLAPMAGVTDQPFRQLCRRLGAGLAVSEMITSDSRLWDSQKTQTRLNHQGEAEPRSVQIAGSDPAMMADAAQLNIERGAQIIDINMGCPAKKVCNKACGSALLKDELLVGKILASVVNAVNAPVTLKIRTGWDQQQRNGVRIAQIAQACGIQCLAVHGRTKLDAYRGEAEYDTIAAIKAAVDIPIIANGDIDSAQKAHFVLQKTGADGVMIGRGAQGNPWIFQEIQHFLTYGNLLAAPTADEIGKTLITHVKHLHAFYGDYRGLRIARKHIGWYLKNQPDGERCRQLINRVDAAQQQILQLEMFFNESKRLQQYEQPFFRPANPQGRATKAAAE